VIPPLTQLVAGRAGSAELRQAAMEGWRDRLAAATVLRALPGWRQCGSADGISGSVTAASLPAGWRQEAAKQLSELAAAGIHVDVDRYKPHPYCYLILLLVCCHITGCSTQWLCQHAPTVNETCRPR